VGNSLFDSRLTKRKKGEALLLEMICRLDGRFNPGVFPFPIPYPLFPIARNLEVAFLCKTYVTGKAILIGKFCGVRLTFVRLGNVYGFSIGYLLSISMPHSIVPSLFETVIKVDNISDSSGGSPKTKSLNVVE